jgi:hypothetical protein
VKKVQKILAFMFGRSEEVILARRLGVPSRTTRYIAVGAVAFTAAVTGPIDGCDEFGPDPGATYGCEGLVCGSSSLTRCKGPLTNIRHEYIKATWSPDPFDIYPLADEWVNTNWCWKVPPAANAGRIVSRNSNPGHNLRSVYGGVSVNGPYVWSSECSGNFDTCLTRFEVQNVYGLTLPGSLPDIAGDNFRCIATRIGTSSGAGDHSRAIHKERCSALTSARATTTARVRGHARGSIQALAGARVAKRIERACEADIRNARHRGSCQLEVLRAYRGLSSKGRAEARAAFRRLQ